MRPRITGGRARGRALTGPVSPGVRPTSARVREALFSLVGHDLAGRSVLDAFGGTGLMGLEAWSRGADVVIVERDRRAARAIRENVGALGASVDVRQGDVLQLAPSLGPFDGVIADPPYAQPTRAVLDALAPLVRGWLVLETDATTPEEQVDGLILDRRRVYGGSALTVYRARPAGEGRATGARDA